MSVLKQQWVKNPYSASPKIIEVEIRHRQTDKQTDRQTNRQTDKFFDTIYGWVWIFSSS